MPELLVVLVVVGVLSILVVPQLEVVKFRMDGQTRGVMAALMAAQRTAVKRQHDVIVAFDTANARVRIHEDEDNDGVRDSEERVRTIPLDENVIFGVGSAPRRSGGTGAVSFTEVQDGMPVVRFLRSGSASQQGVVYLTSSRSAVATRYAKDTRSIQVDRATGRATWYYYRSPQWKQGF